MISVLIPVYNGSRFLTHTLDSIKNQTYTDFELVLVDDGSTDNSIEIMERFIDQNPNIKITLVAQENAGPSAARNRAIDLANGSYIQFFDADDLMHPRMLERAVELIKTKNCDIASFDFGRFRSTDDIDLDDLINRSYDKELAAIRKDSLKLSPSQLVLKYGFGTPRSLYKADVFKTLRFNTNITSFEDHLLNFQALGKGFTFSYTPEVLMYYRNHNTETRLSSNNDINKQLEGVKLLFKEVDALGTNNFKIFGKQMLANRLGNFAFHSHKTKDEVSASSCTDLLNELSLKPLKISSVSLLNLCYSVFGIKFTSRIASILS